MWVYVEKFSSPVKPKKIHQTKSQEFPEHFHFFTDVIFQFKFRLWLSDLLNRAIDSDMKVLNHLLLTLGAHRSGHLNSPISLAISNINENPIKRRKILCEFMSRSFLHRSIVSNYLTDTCKRQKYVI
jgi:hypothetical protein